MEEVSSVSALDTWDKLPEAVLQRCIPWERLLEEYGEPPGTTHGLVHMISHLHWLLPVAELLKQHPAAARLNARVHHAVIEVPYQGCSPGGVTETEAVMIYASEEGRFEMSRYFPMREVHQYEMRISFGSAEEVAAAVIELAVPVPAAQNAGPGTRLGPL